MFGLQYLQNLFPSGDPFHHAKALPGLMGLIDILSSGDCTATDRLMIMALNSTQNHVYEDQMTDYLNYCISGTVTRAQYSGQEQLIYNLNKMLDMMWYLRRGADELLRTRSRARLGWSFDFVGDKNPSVSLCTTVYRVPMKCRDLAAKVILKFAELNAKLLTEVRSRGSAALFAPGARVQYILEYLTAMV